MTRTLSMLTAIALALTTVVALTPALAEDKKAAKHAAPDFTLTDQDGNTVSLSDFGSDTIVVLEWTNFKCPYVKRHYNDDFKTMTTLASEYKGKGVVWLAIDSSSFATPESIKEDAKANNLPYPILLDSSGDVAKAYHAKTTPDMRIIRGGEVLYRGAIDNDKKGKLPADERVNYVQQALDQIIAGQDVTTPQTKPYGCSVKLKK